MTYSSNFWENVPGGKRIRVDITRKEFKDQTGHTPDPDTARIVVYSGITRLPVREYVFTDDFFPVSKPAQITELERLYSL